MDHNVRCSPVAVALSPFPTLADRTPTESTQWPAPRLPTPSPPRRRLLPRRRRPARQRRVLWPARSTATALRSSGAILSRRSAAGALPAAAHVLPAAAAGGIPRQSAGRIRHQGRHLRGYLGSVGVLLLLGLFFLRWWDDVKRGGLVGIAAWRGFGEKEAAVESASRAPVSALPPGVGALTTCGMGSSRDHIHLNSGDLMARRVGSVDRKCPSPSGLAGMYVNSVSPWSHRHLQPRFNRLKGLPTPD